MTLMSGLPAEQREAWHAFFNYFAFQTEGDPGAHLPDNVPDVLGKLSPSDKNQIMAFIAEHLKRASG
jgi:hypothetical protein